MKSKLSHFRFNKREQNGIFVFIILLVLGFFIIAFKEHLFVGARTVSLKQDKVYEAQIDSLKQKAAAERVAYQQKPFNPNFISDYKGYLLGMKVDEIERLHAFRAKEQWINSAQEFQAVTKVSDSLLTAIAPLFKFPDWVKQNQIRKAAEPKHLSYANKSDLNTITFEELLQVKGIGEVLANRIIKYRTKLGGFLHDIQLKDIYGLNYEAQKNLLAQSTVKTPPAHSIRDLNTIEVIELSEIPYFNYESARDVVQYRKLHQKIKNFNELAKIESFPAHKLDRIQLYLKID
ncbi:helix-hairpin-helix domain-containing protein [Mesonia sp. HuA40]|uniref:helix-hairpin-helix domain-containing protein n=1 Tax=Mesonia sp. HuA40 TaxID=2602761 RepID=UPI0011C8A617|nr:helix-hairpin-helix domain-containing protein [Mesonia sp. HuA40]TXK75214.1 helix-hairpin-helix domain-containing protein [Mesonia sp. HuA40]